MAGQEDRLHLRRVVQPSKHLFGRRRVEAVEGLVQQDHPWRQEKGSQQEEFPACTERSLAKPRIEMLAQAQPPYHVIEAAFLGYHRTPMRSQHEIHESPAGHKRIERGLVGHVGQ